MIIKILQNIVYWWLMLLILYSVWWVVRAYINRWLTKNNVVINFDRIIMQPEIMDFEIVINNDGGNYIHINDVKEGIDVHESGIQSSLTSALAKLKPYRSRYDRKLITNVIDKYQNSVTTRTLDAMEKINGLFHQYRELDVLMMVYNRMQFGKLDHSSLVEELADAKGKCLGGRVTRIVQSLEGIDNIVTLKSLDIYKTELTETFLKLRKDYVAKLSNEDQKIYELGDSDTASEDRIINDMHGYIDDELRKIYLGNDLLSERNYLRLTQELFQNL
jgi:hypothetical protein